MGKIICFANSGETILKDMLIMLNRCEQVLDVKIRRKHEILNGWRKNTKSVVKF